jgi:hypothetical protein
MLEGCGALERFSCDSLTSDKMAISPPATNERRAVALLVSWSLSDYRMELAEPDALND